MERKDREKCDLCGGDYRFFKLLYDLDGFKIMKCNKCGLVFRNAVLSPQEISQLYSSDYFNKEQEDYFLKNEEIKIKDFTKRIGEIEELYKTKGKLLDIGSGLGTFLNICQKRGWQAYGEDVSEYAASYVQEKLGLKVYEGKLSDLELPNNCFDIITLWDVIEHSENPSVLLKEIYRILKKDGLVVAQTAMEDSLVYKSAHWTYCLTNGWFKNPVVRGHPIHHSTFYSLKTLEKTLETAGFEVIGKKRVSFPKQLISVRKRGVFSRITYDLLDLVGNIIHRPLEAIVYGKK